MTDELRAQMNGLVTDPSRILAGDSGFVELDNALCKREGLVEPRGGFQARMSPVSSADDYTHTIYLRETAFQQWFVATNGTNSRAYKWGEAANCLQVSGDETGMRAEPFADRQCWTFRKALRMLDLPGSFSTTSLSRLPGAPVAPTPLITAVPRGASTTLLYPPISGAAYRVVIVRHFATTQGDQIVISAPCDRVVFWNLDAVDRADATISIPTTNLGIGDEIQIYRTAIVDDTTNPPTLDPGDEMMMLTSYRIQTAPSFTSYFTYRDSNSDGAWSGPSLYTNDTQEGIAQSNYRIRAATDVAFYNQMAFYAQGTPGHTANLTLRSINNNNFIAGTDPISPANSLRSFVFTADRTNASAVLTNCNPTAAVLSDTYGLVVGQLVNLATFDPEDATSAMHGTITVIDTGLNRITLSLPAASTLVGASYVAWDWVGIQPTSSSTTIQRIFPNPWNNGGTYTYSATSGVFYGLDPIVLNRTSFGGADMGRAWAMRYIGTGSNAAPANRSRLYTVQSTDWPYGGQVQLRFEWDDLGPVYAGDSSFSTSFEVVSSKPFAFSQQLGLTYDANLCRSKQEGGVARLYYSKLQLPESVPLGNYFDIGNLAAPIVRVVATTDCLWVLKSDGLWRITGTSPEDLIVQQFDPLCRMSSDQSTAPWVRRLGNVVYAWTVSGIVAIDPSGVHPIDGAIATQVRAVTPVVSSSATISVTRPFAASSLRESLVVFGCQAATALRHGFTFVYNTQTGTWATWSTQLGDTLSSDVWFQGSGDADNETMLIGSYNGFSLYTDVPQFYTATLNPGVLPITFADVIAGPLAATLTSLTIASVSGANALYSVAGSVLLPGCIIQQGGVTVSKQYLVLSVVPGVSFTVDRAGLVAGACAISYYPIKQTLTYAATTEGTPAEEKYFTELCLGFQNIRGGLSFRHRCRTRGDATPSSWATEFYPNPEAIATLPTCNGLSADREFETGRDFPTTETRGTGIEVTIELNQACVYSALDAMTVRGDARSTRVGAGS
jgi:hypothetical protein